MGFLLQKTASIQPRLIDFTNQYSRCNNFQNLLMGQMNSLGGCSARSRSRRSARVLLSTFRRRTIAYQIYQARQIIQRGVWPRVHIRHEFAFASTALAAGIQSYQVAP